MPRTAEAARWYDAAWVERARTWQRRARQASRSSLQARVRRVQARAFFIVQCAISAGVAYFITGGILRHETPIFAAVAAVIVLGQSFGQRLRRVAEVVIGVALGVFIGDAFVHYAGGGYWQLTVVVTVAMVAATLLDEGVGMTATAGIQSAVVTILVPPPGQAFLRWTDAVIGGVVALLAATITPVAPLRRPRQYAAGVLEEVGEILRASVAAVRDRDLEAASAVMTRARDSEALLVELQEAADDGLAVVRTSPFRRRHLPAVQVIADLLIPLDRCVRNLRVLVRRVEISLRTGEQVPAAYLRMVEELAEVTDQMASTMAIREVPESSRRALLELGELTTYSDERPSLSSEVIRAQVRSMVVDLLMVTGLDYDEACDVVPESFELVDGHEYEVDEDDSPGLDPLTRR